jgi:iron complex outermembrane receptor protein
MELRTKLHVSAAILAIAASAPAYAQDQRDKNDDTIVVTGSRLHQLAIDSPIPVKTMDKEDLDESGYMDLGEALSDLPGVDTDINLANNQNATTENGLSTVELRGAGRSRTLTLIDGHRTVSDTSSGNAVNLATLPTFFVDRVEISTGGASAVYGSDAIAGVVNIITERDLNGIKARAQGTATNDGGGDGREYSIGIGHKFGDSFYVMGALTYQNQDVLRGADRDWALRSVSYNDDTNKLTSPALSTTIPGGLYLSKFYYDATGLKSNFVSSVNGYDTRPAMTLVAPRETWNAALKLRYEISDSIKFSTVLMYSNIDTFAPRPPVQLSSSDTYGALDEFTVGRIPLTNPLIPAAIRGAAPTSGVNFSRRMMELGTLGAGNTRETWRGWASLQGQLVGGWDWELTYGYGHYRQDQVRQNGVNYQNVRNALNVTTINGQLVCADATARANGCVPLDLFGLTSVTPAMADYIRSDASFRAVNTQNTLSGNIAGSPLRLPAGPVQIAAGFELRRDTGATQSDAISAAGLSYWQDTPAYKAKIQSAGGYFETSVPLLRDKPFFYRLSLDGALGVTHYDLENVGTTYSYRAAAQWRPIPGLGFRGTYSRAERAPTITELFSPPRGNIDSVTDICSGVTAATAGTVAQNCRANGGIAAAIAANGVFRQLDDDISVPNSGNPDLKQETAHTFTAGVVLNPGFLRGFQASVDYWDIKIQNVIRSIEPEDVMYLCYAAEGAAGDRYCNKITRNADGQLTRLVDQVDNQDQMRRRGIDFALSYRFTLDPLGISGRFNLSATYTRLLELTARYQTADGLEVLDGKGEVGDAKDVARGSISWTTPHVMLKWTTAYIGPSIDDNSEIADFAQKGITSPLFMNVPAFTRHDFSFALTPSLRDPNLRFYGTVRNVFNKDGPFLPTGTASGSSNNYSSVYGALGRTFTAGVQFRF